MRQLLRACRNQPASVVFGVVVVVVVAFTLGCCGFLTKLGMTWLCGFSFALVLGVVGCGNYVFRPRCN